MSGGCRSWWQNCAKHADADIECIDRLENEIHPLKPEIVRVRKLIGTFEICHHKSDRWIDNILEAIGTGDTDKGLGSRPVGQLHDAEAFWRDVCEILSDWVAGQHVSENSRALGSISTSNLLARLDKRSPLKIWQVERVIQKVRSFIGFPASHNDPDTQYQWLLIDVKGDWEHGYLNECPSAYKAQEEFWLSTAKTMIHDRFFGKETTLSLALAIDMLWPCHRDFLGNLQLVLGAIGGNLYPDRPFAACGRNIHLHKQQDQLRELCDGLEAYGNQTSSADSVKDIHEKLGNPSSEKIWLAASLAKTIQLQLNPPREMRDAVALDTPDWLRDCRRKSENPI